MSTATDTLYLMTPVSNETMLKSLLERGWYVFAERTAGRKSLKPGDRLCFYKSRSPGGIVAEATVKGVPERRHIAGVAYPPLYEWAFPVSGVRLFFEKPIVITADVRKKLDAFRSKNPETPWAWFVQGTRRLTRHDFDILIGRT